MAWKDEVDDGIKELLSDGAGVIIERGKNQIPALQGNGVSYEQVINGGSADIENPSLLVRRTDLAAASPAWNPRPGDTFKVSGKKLKVSSVSFDPADPSVRIFTEGEDQQ